MTTFTDLIAERLADEPELLKLARLRATAAAAVADAQTADDWGLPANDVVAGRARMLERLLAAARQADGTLDAALDAALAELVRPLRDLERLGELTGAAAYTAEARRQLRKLASTGAPLPPPGDGDAGPAPGDPAFAAWAAGVAARFGLAAPS